MVRFFAGSSVVLFVLVGLSGCANRPEAHTARFHAETGEDEIIGRIFGNTSDVPAEELRSNMRDMLESDANALGLGPQFDTWANVHFIASGPSREYPEGMLRIDRLEPFPKLTEWPVEPFSVPGIDDVFPMAVYTLSASAPLHFMLHPDRKDPAYDEMGFRRFIPRDGLEYGVGEVWLEFFLDSEGCPHDISVRDNWSGEPQVAEFVLAQFRNWQFHPVISSTGPRIDTRYEIGIRIHSGRSGIPYANAEPLPRNAGPVDGYPADDFVPRPKVLPAPTIR